jgi:hypothetical protein
MPPLLRVATAISSSAPMSAFMIHREVAVLVRHMSADKTGVRFKTPVKQIFFSVNLVSLYDGAHFPGFSLTRSLRFSGRRGVS